MIRTLAALVVSLFLPMAGAQDADFSGRVVGITDGDTLTLLTSDRRQVRIRLAEIDTPERGQPYASRAQQALADLVFQEEVRVRYVDTDRYGRIVGRIYVDDLDVSAAMVRSGAAWVYREYVTDMSLYDFEREAQAAERGLWGLPEAQQVPPWEWRQGVRSRRGAEPASEPAPAAFTCGSKTYCREMNNCEEALFYLRQCGLTRLDGDRDGIPCEAICR